MLIIWYYLLLYESFNLYNYGRLTLIVNLQQWRCLRPGYTLQVLALLTHKALARSGLSAAIPNVPPLTQTHE